jgi:hypothetical protein
MRRDETTDCSVTHIGAASAAARLCVAKHLLIQSGSADTNAALDALASSSDGFRTPCP